MTQFRVILTEWHPGNLVHLWIEHYMKNWSSGAWLGSLQRWEKLKGLDGSGHSLWDCGRWLASPESDFGVAVFPGTSSKYMGSWQGDQEQKLVQYVHKTNQNHFTGTRFIFLTRFLIFLVSGRGRSNTGIVSLVVLPLSDNSWVLQMPPEKRKATWKKF